MGSASLGLVDIQESFVKNLVYGELSARVFVRLSIKLLFLIADHLSFSLLPEGHISLLLERNILVDLG